MLNSGLLSVGEIIDLFSYLPALNRRSPLPPISPSFFLLYYFYSFQLVSRCQQQPSDWLLTSDPVYDISKSTVKENDGTAGVPQCKLVVLL
jgi:hypothetical protein